MISIIKKELLGYFTNMTGYVFLALLTLVTGIFFVQYNVISGAADFSYAIFATIIAFLLIIPILTMRLFSEESRQKTDQLLFTSGVSVTKVVYGKFISAVLLFLAGVAIITTFPLLISPYGETMTAKLITGYIGYILIVSSFIAIGLHVSSRTDNQNIAAVATFGIMFMLFFMDSIVAAMPKDRMSSLVFVFAVIAFIAYFIYMNTKSIMISSAVFAILGVAAYLVFRHNGMLFDALIYRALIKFSLLDRFDDFTIGVVKLDSVIFYLSVIFTFNFLTVNTIEKKRWS